ncbi:MAG: aminotransferase class I/II-fold pyridoxal phosphate-dependent enzyme [Acidimicrobiales bacterium]
MSATDRLTADLFWRVRLDRRAGGLELAGRADAMPYFLPVGSPLDREVVVAGEPTLMFGSNNYLGLANDPRVLDAAREAIGRYGSGCTGSRLMNGTLSLHCDLEAELAGWVGREAALVFSAGYLANLSTVSTLCHRGDVVITDARNHASLKDGARLSGAAVESVRHNDLEQLETKLDRLGALGRAILVVWDSVFSMEGDVAPIGELADLCHRSGARLLVDEAHSLGVMGPQGAGICHDLDPSADLVMGTFSKSLASCGGFVAGEADVIDFLRINARPFLFTASTVPAAVGAALEAVHICRREPWRAERVVSAAARLAQGLRELGTAVSWGGAAIVSVPMADELKAVMTWRGLLSQGVYVNLGLFPAVPRGAALLRLSTTATHRDGDIDRCVEAFANLAGLNVL